MPLTRGLRYASMRGLGLTGNSQGALNPANQGFILGSDVFVVNGMVLIPFNPATPAVVYPDPDSYTKLLLLFQGFDGATTFVDSSLSANTVTKAGSIQLDTEYKKIGISTCLASGSGTGLHLNGEADFTFGTGDWTIDFWFRPAVINTTQALYDMRPASAAWHPLIMMVNPGTLWFYANGSARITGTAALSAGTWQHVAVAKGGTNTRMFVNGTQVGSTYTDTNDYVGGNAGLPAIGCDRANSLNANGNLSAFRVSKGLCRWTSTFTPPALISDYFG